MGNDALAEMPGCAVKGKSAAECGDRLFADVLPRMEKLLIISIRRILMRRLLGSVTISCLVDLAAAFVTHDLFSTVLQ